MRDPTNERLTGSGPNGKLTARMSIRSMHVIGSSRLGGAERFFIRLTAAMSRAGHDIITVTRRHSHLNKQLDPAVTQLHIPMRGQWDLFSRIQLRRLVDRYEPSVVQSYMGRATRLTRIHRSDVLHVARLGGYYRLHTYKHANCWVGNTQGICDYLVENGLPRERVFHIGNFVDPPRPLDPQMQRQLRANYRLRDEDRIILAMGRLHRNKAFDMLLNAFAAVPSTIGPGKVVLLLLGDGPLRQQLEQQIEQLGIGDRVVMPGWKDDVSAHLKLADIFVCSSRHEPLGNVILEAWSEGVPVVSTRSSGPVELIEDGKTGLLTPVDDPTAMAKHIESLLIMDPNTRQQIADSSRRALNDHHAEDAIVQAYADMYTRLRRTA